MNLSAQLTSIKLMVSDKVRLRQCIIEAQNLFHSYNGRVIVTVYVKHHSTARAVGAFGVIWNEEHKLNITQPNCLSVNPN